MKVGDKVEIISCDLFPEYVGKIGKIESIHNSGTFYKVSFKGKMIPFYAVEDCLKKITDSHD